MKPDVWHFHLRYNISKVARTGYLGKKRYPMVVKQNLLPMMYRSDDPHQCDYENKIVKVTKTIFKWCWMCNF